MTDGSPFTNTGRTGSKHRWHLVRSNWKNGFINLKTNENHPHHSPNPLPHIFGRDALRPVSFARWPYVLVLVCGVLDSCFLLPNLRTGMNHLPRNPYLWRLQPPRSLITDQKASELPVLDYWEPEVQIQMYAVSRCKMRRWKIAREINKKLNLN